MAVFALSFRIGSEGDWSSRYNSVVDKIKSEAGHYYWDETTSFFVLTSTKSAREIADSVYFGSMFNQSWDIILVVNLSVKDHGTKGNFVSSATLDTLMSYR